MIEAGRVHCLQRYTCGFAPPQKRVLYRCGTTQVWEERRMNVETAITRAVNQSRRDQKTE